MLQKEHNFILIGSKLWLKEMMVSSSTDSKELSILLIHLHYKSDYSLGF